jgi:hypothetical protein
MPMLAALQKAYRLRCARKSQPHLGSQGRPLADAIRPDVTD